MAQNFVKAGSRPRKRASRRADAGEGAGCASGRRTTLIRAGCGPAQLDANPPGKEIAHRKGVTIFRSQLSKVLRQKGGFAFAARATP
jgi:hypothetical protein